MAAAAAVVAAALWLLSPVPRAGAEPPGPVEPAGPTEPPGSARPAEPAGGLPRLEPLALAAELGAAVEPLSVQDFLEAALRFSGVGPGEMEARRGRLLRLAEEARDGLARIQDPRSRAEGILSFLHERVFRQYDERQTRVDVLLDSGRYNCVSSAVLYVFVAKALGFRAEGVRTADHAFCQVAAGDSVYDVETTSPLGFDPGTRREFTDSFGRVTGYTYVPPSHHGRRNDVGERGLLALILYNRSAFASDRRAYAEALPPAVDAYAVLQDRESCDRLVVSLLNLASWYGMEHDFARGLLFLERAQERFGDPRLTSLRQDLLHNWVLDLVGRRSFDGAEALLDESRDGGRLSQAEWHTLTVYLYQMRAQEAARSNFAVAAGLIRQGLAKTGPDPALRRSFEVYVHSQAVASMRAGRLEEAAAVLEEGLEADPESALLQRDRRQLSERRSGQ